MKRNEKNYKRFIIFLSQFLILVMALPLVAAPFIDNGDGTIIDTGTNLRWQKCSAGQNNDATCSGTATAYSWQNALGYCNGLGLSGKTWRLPSVNELKSLIDESHSSPTINTTIFPATQSSAYWTETTYTPNATFAWIISFSGGWGNSFAYGDGKRYTYFVRCVSSGPSS